MFCIQCCLLNVFCWIPLSRHWTVYWRRPWLYFSVFSREMPVFTSATPIISGLLIWGAFEPTITFSLISTINISSQCNTQIFMYYVLNYGIVCVCSTFIHWIFLKHMTFLKSLCIIDDGGHFVDEKLNFSEIFCNILVPMYIVIPIVPIPIGLIICPHYRSIMR